MFRRLALAAILVAAGSFFRPPAAGASQSPGLHRPQPAPEELIEVRSYSGRSRSASVRTRSHYFRPASRNVSRGLRARLH
ncbi:hypothetical protein MVG78_16870 [Roseomonas gilardii subsp. gilardii]|uniref:hypothetical protein n=1 Tax=Roseomonas gilardii TaxID=257708 RepID=UPI001FFA02AE|nr:hypothetical protein [Roseomonas gilardii]UPG72170.1 hypothetical protein MVG78_16870 [Roseomonas gilardii subsp. gilardii]